MLPPEVVEATTEACRSFGDTGMSLMEIPHRGEDFVEVLEEARRLVRKLLKVPEGYSVLFIGGGARLQFCMVPYNFLQHKAAYLNTGTWAHAAQQEAQLFGEVVEVASSAADNYSYIPRHFTIPSDADYLHTTSNNTIFGTQLREDLESPIPIISDMSSDIFSRPVDVSRYGMIYGGAQKNLSMAGVSFAIVREDLLGRVSRPIPTILDYRTHIRHQSMYNTPPVVPIYCALKNLQWIESQGGVEEMARRAEARAALLYDAIDRHPLFRGTAHRDSRSLMNVTFVMTEGQEHRQEDFLRFAHDRGIRGIRGHRSVGGFRASLYNAMPMEGVQALVECMEAFN